MEDWLAAFQIRECRTGYGVNDFQKKKKKNVRGEMRNEGMEGGGLESEEGKKKWEN